MAKIIISGGGTGGHIFPAIAIADALRQIDAATELLFVGASGRMEMERVPAAGYAIEGLPVTGLRRGSLFRNVENALNLLQSIRGARSIIERFRPDAAIGVGGYASVPVLYVAQRKGIPTLIQEQNSYAGKSNKWLASRARKICVAYEGMERFFPKRKIVLTGNPVRQDLCDMPFMRGEALQYFGLEMEKRTILVLGGSLGADTINRSVQTHLASIGHTPQVQWIWQCGKPYYEQCAAKLAQKGVENVRLLPFVERMDYAYSAADLVISRAGAGTISELCVAGKPCILVPSPNVAEDHQTRNAIAVETQGGAVMMPDRSCLAMLVHKALMMAQDREGLRALARKMFALAKPDAAADIAKLALQLTETPQ